jgi:hypothetical protein
VEYLITEKCVGDILADKLDTASSSCHHIDNIANLYNDLAAIPFSQYGSTFYKEDVDPLLQVKPFMLKESHKTIVLNDFVSVPA